MVCDIIWPYLTNDLISTSALLKAVICLLIPYPAPGSPLIQWSSNSHFFHLRQSINADVSTTSARRSRWTSQCTWRLCGCWVQPRISSASWPDEGTKLCQFLLSAKWRYAFRMAPSQYQWPPGLFHVMFRMGFQPKPSFAPSWEVCHTQGCPAFHWPLLMSFIYLRFLASHLEARLYPKGKHLGGQLKISAV